jgi:branched-chain amino acid transport system ATP-binding protein
LGGRDDKEGRSGRQMTADQNQRADGAHSVRDSSWSVARTGSFAFIALIAVTPVLGLPDFYVHILVLMTIFIVFATSLDILMGYAGMPSLGHAAFFGIAAYGVGIITVKLGQPWWTGVLVGLAACLAIGLLFGLIALRTTGLYFLLITLALSQLLWGAAFRWGSFTGGFNGLPGIPRPAEWLASSKSFFYAAFAIAAFLLFLMDRLVKSPFGLSLRAMSDSESRMQSLGYNVWLHRYFAFVITGVLAGCAGAMNALYNGFVSPYDLSIAMSAEAILMVILGGAGTLWGPAIGAILIVALRYFLSVYFNNWLIILGAFFIFVVLFAPNGVLGWLTPRKKTQQGNEASTSQMDGRFEVLMPEKSQSPPNVHSMALECDHIAKSFGGIASVKDVSFQIKSGDRVALLGPNGAGKTTLFNMISGILVPSSGRLRFQGNDISNTSQYARARLGLGRTFQITNLFPKLTVHDHLRLCGISFCGKRLNMFAKSNSIPDVERFTRVSLEQAGLWQFRDLEVRNLSYGHQRQLEVAMAVSMRPSVLLLDEPAAGLSVAEIGPIVELVRALDPRITILIVEHDMDVAFAVADNVIVFNHGELVASGTPAEIRQNAEVSRIYLGRRHA